ncbi:MAG: FtsX-like permease family protein, partial [Bacteroidota bacterium]
TVFRFTSSTEWLVQYEDKIFQERNFVFADSTAFDIFNWKLLSGNPETALDEPNSIVLTKSIASKYFGSEDPVGKTIEVDQNDTFEVTGVMEDVPSNTHFTFDGMISMSTFRNYRPGIFESWGYVDFYTYFILNENANIDQLRSRTAEFEKKYTSHWERTRYDLDFEPMSQAYLHSVAGRQPGQTGSMTNLYIFSLIGVFILIIACINFINLSTARSLERAKEVGIRKAVGAHKNSLVSQFLSEFFLLTFLAGLLATIMVFLIFPTFQELTGKPISYKPLFTIEFAVGFISIIALIGFIAGSYPAFLLSKFKPASVLKGNFRSSARGIALRKGLVTFQFMLTIILLIGTAVVFSQLKHLQNHDLGFDKEHMVIVDFGYDGYVQDKMKVIKRSLGSVNGVVSVAASRAVPGDFLPNAGTQIEGPSGLMVDFGPGIYEVDADFIPNYKMEMAAGRPFSHDYASDSMEALIINEAAAKLWGYNNPEDVVGKKFDQWGKQGKVIGVIKDFNYQSLHNRVEPLSVRFEPNSMSKFSIRIQSTDISTTLNELEKEWKDLVPHRPFNYDFLDENFSRLYQADARFGRVFGAFALLAIFIACLGLFGLTTYTTTQRTKEIGIRKVLGASVSMIVLLLSKDFVKLLLIAFLIAIPASWYASQNWLDEFAYRVSVGAGVYVIAAIIVSAIALITMSWQSVRAARQNPVTSLRSE